MDLPSPELVFPLLMDAFARRGRGVADLIALSGKKGNPPRPHPLPHLRTTAPDPQVAAPGTLTSGMTEFRNSLHGEWKQNLKSCFLYADYKTDK
ncbi:unnamed protein product [Miscanthus lutarioriparius]|uniref:Uncharacterized protein n=1 Tax=Miscanthus lutarioriparius TaxID=422564 RepID=A0A811PHT3_9POAL|nr:unnamed protein product [Miscanthus lutarioriparius]